MKVVAIIQARLGSTRLPRKVLRDICGEPMIHHVIRRVEWSWIPHICVAIPEEDAGSELEDAIRERPLVECFVGTDHPSKDVLTRYVQAAGYMEAEVVVRITADCPLIDPEVIHRTVREYMRDDSPWTFASTAPSGETGYPDGQDVEVFSRGLLVDANRETREREHVTTWMRYTASNVRWLPVTYDGPVGGRRKWSVDTEEDLDFVRSVYKGMGKKVFGMGEVVEWLKEKQR